MCFVFLSVDFCLCFEENAKEEDERSRDRNVHLHIYTKGKGRVEAEREKRLGGVREKRWTLVLFDCPSTTRIPGRTGKRSFVVCRQHKMIFKPRA